MKPGSMQPVELQTSRLQGFTRRAFCAARRFWVAPPRPFVPFRGSRDGVFVLVRKLKDGTTTPKKREGLSAEDPAAPEQLLV